MIKGPGTSSSGNLQDGNQACGRREIGKCKEGITPRGQSEAGSGGTFLGGERKRICCLAVITNQTHTLTKKIEKGKSERGTLGDQR